MGRARRFRRSLCHREATSFISGSTIGYRPGVGRPVLVRITSSSASPVSIDPLEMRKVSIGPGLRHAVSGKDRCRAPWRVVRASLAEQRRRSPWSGRVRWSQAPPGASSNISRIVGTQWVKVTLSFRISFKSTIGRIAPRKNLLGARGGRRVGAPPGMDMKHGRHRHVDARAVKAALLGRHSECRELAIVWRTICRWLK